jgi:hypothetical protein
LISDDKNTHPYITGSIIEDAIAKSIFEFAFSDVEDGRIEVNFKKE